MGVLFLKYNNQKINFETKKIVVEINSDVNLLTYLDKVEEIDVLEGNINIDTTTLGVKKEKLLVKLNNEKKNINLL